MWCGVVEERVYGGLRGYSSVLLWRDGQQIWTLVADGGGLRDGWRASSCFGMVLVCNNGEVVVGWGIQQKET
jgi:hypothetical protein